MSESKTGQKRKAIEAVMQTATREAPLSAPVIAQLSGVEVTNARCHIGNILGECLAYNLNPGHRGGALYVWGKPPKPEPLPQLRDAPTDREQEKPTGYTGTKWRIRAGGDDHLSHPSRRGDDYVEHRAPIPMAGFVDAVGVHGGRLP